MFLFKIKIKNNIYINYLVTMNNLSIYLFIYFFIYKKLKIIKNNT